MGGRGELCGRVLSGISCGCLCPSPLCWGGFLGGGTRPPPSVPSMGPLCVAAWPHPVSEPHRKCGDPRPIPLRLSQGGGVHPCAMGFAASNCGGAVPHLSFLARCQRGQPVGPGCWWRWEGGSPLHPQSFTLPWPGGVRGCRGPSPGLHEGCFPTGLLFSWKSLVVEGKGGSPLVPLYGAPGWSQCTAPWHICVPLPTLGIPFPIASPQLWGSP